MIQSFKHKGLKRLFEWGDRGGIGAGILPRVENILSTLDVADAPQALDLPGYRLHQLREIAKGFGPLRFLPIGGSSSVLKTEMPMMLNWLIITRKGRRTCP
jgi:proteic killer suppression protein